MEPVFFCFSLSHTRNADWHTISMMAYHFLLLLVLLLQAVVASPLVVRIDNSDLAASAKATTPRIDSGDCRPMHGTSETACKTKMKRCLKDHGIRMKWGTRGCKNAITGAWDGGCMCEGSCPFRCEKACQENKKQCAWDKQSKVCKNKITGATGHMTLCDGAVCRPNGFFCTPGTLQGNCCDGLLCEVDDGLHSCCSPELGFECKQDYECCGTNVCSAQGECVQV